jgi:Na+-transporting methylmalonyl-CoA/oxaloacetate decarboxylase gamma subunit
MPLLVLGVFSFLLFLTMGVLAISAVVSEQRKEAHDQPKGKA